MSSQTELTPTQTRGVFQRLGGLVVRRPVVIIGFWIVLAGVLA